MGPIVAALSLIVAGSAAGVGGELPAWGQFDAVTAQASVPAPPAVIRGIRRTVLAEVVRVTIEVDREVPYRTEQLDRPARVLFDFPGTRLAAAVPEGSLSYTEDLVRRIRIGRHPNETTRIVLDLDGIRRYSTYTLYNPYRLIIDCEREEPAKAVTAAPRAALPAALPSTALAMPWTLGPAVWQRRALLESRATTDMASLVPVVDSGRLPPPVLAAAPWATMFAHTPALVPSSLAGPSTASRPDTRSLAGVSQGQPDKPVPNVASGAESAERPAPPAANSRGGFSLARQLGLGISRIVLDAGHGGRDPGAEGIGISEAEVVLDVALRLERLLIDDADVEVVMTRRTDEFVPLEERTAIANRAQADLFLSIHANAARSRTIRGVETYFLNFAKTADAQAVAARENAATGGTMNNLPDFVRAIALNTKLDESKDFASLVQQAMVRRLRSTNRDLRDLGVKQAPFVVLIGAAMPSVLVEISFLTNGQEGRLLRGAPYRQRIAEALFDGIKRYQKTLKASASAAPRPGGRSGRVQ